jgi:hypothetical protein
MLGTELRLRLAIALTLFQGAVSRRRNPGSESWMRGEERKGKRPNEKKKKRNARCTHRHNPHKRMAQNKPRKHTHHCYEVQPRREVPPASLQQCRRGSLRPLPLQHPATDGSLLRPQVGLSPGQHCSRPPAANTQLAGLQSVPAARAPAAQPT